jgi:signal transduction histidine kinase
MAPLFLAAVMIASWNGGLGPGLLAIALAGVVLDLLRVSRAHPSHSWESVLRIGAFLLAAGVISSLTSRHRALEQALRWRDRQKDDLLATLAHELRTPVSAIVNALCVLRAGSPDPASDAQARGIVERQARYIARLAEDLLDVSRIGLGKLRLAIATVDANLVAAEAVEAARPLIDLRGHRLEVELASGPLHVDADPTRLTQVIINLLTNAANYTPPGGVIRLAIEREGDEIVVRVIDSGVGVSPEMRARVFDLFVQGEGAARGGLGLGLHLVKRLVELQGGRVEVRSNGPGQGSEFLVRFRCTCNAKPLLAGV